MLGEMLLAISKEGVFPSEVKAVIQDILHSIKEPHKQELPDESAYDQPTERQVMDFFPAYPLVRGHGQYQTKTDTRTGCRKDSQNHPKLTPGVFTMFCFHGVCLGFQVMTSVESPKTAFYIPLPLDT